jgi:YNFM family putative membrane transporter
MGIYIAGTAVGGMSGRLLAAALTDAFGWRAAVAATGMFGLGAALLVAALLPAARFIRPAAIAGAGSVFAIYRAQLKNPALVRMFVQGFFFMGVFVAVYNYLTFRLVEPPYSLGHTAIGSVFLIYLVALISSPWAGSVAGVRGRRRTLGLSLALMLAGVLVTMLPSLVTIVAGVGLVTFGFFATQSVLSSWVGLNAGNHRAQASSLYIVCYYIGGSVAGTAAGIFWNRYAWPGVVGFVLVFIAGAIVVLPSMQKN